MSPVRGSLLYRMPAGVPPAPDKALSELRPTWRGQSNIMRRLPVVNASYGYSHQGHYRLLLRGQVYEAGMGFWAPMALTYDLQPGCHVSTRG